MLSHHKSCHAQHHAEFLLSAMHNIRSMHNLCKFTVKVACAPSRCILHADRVQADRVQADRVLYTQRLRCRCSCFWCTLCVHDMLELLVELKQSYACWQVD